ncbi:MAG: adenine phosphoribosyltransferase [Frankiaceae bacterium]|nr:adenine phosphoribosyltransferase [Frankiaceae bacterium]
MTSAVAARGSGDVGSRIAPYIRDVPDYPTPGILFKDITPLLADADAFADTVVALSEPFEALGHVDIVVGIEARGFILAAPVAHHLHAGFVPVRKAGKLPGATYDENYSLEYGTATIQLHKDAFAPGARVLIVDDVLATGGTAAAAARLIERAGATVAGVAVLLELAFLNGRETLRDVPTHALLTF